jgi:Tol biopolymer transport system component
MQVNGQDMRTIGTAPSGDNRLVWTADGTRLVFSDGKDIWISAQLDLRNLTGSAGPHNYSATLSPDGTRIAFVSDRDGNAEI